jgi:integrase
MSIWSLPSSRSAFETAVICGADRRRGYVVSGRRVAPVVAEDVAAVSDRVAGVAAVLACARVDRGVAGGGGAEGRLPQRGVAAWRPGQVEAMLGSCDRRRPAGLRDYAMLTLLARVGLRRSEVAGLRLDDIDWRSGELAVGGKGRRFDRLP